MLGRTQAFFLLGFALCAEHNRVKLRSAHRKKTRSQPKLAALAAAEAAIFKPVFQDTTTLVAINSTDTQTFRDTASNFFVPWIHHPLVKQACHAPIEDSIGFRGKFI